MTPNIIKAVIKDKEYSLTPVTVGDMRALRARILGERIGLARLLLKELSPEERSPLLTAVMNEPLKPSDVAAALMGQDGMLFVIHRCMRANHPDVTLEFLFDSISPEDLTELLPVYLRLIGRKDPTPPTAAKEENK